MIKGAFHFCIRCAKIVRTEGGRCQHCGLSVTKDETGCHFLSDSQEPLDPSKLIPAETLLMDRFQIKRHLGTGRFGSVYLVLDLLRSAELALRVVEIGPWSEKSAAIRFQCQSVVCVKATDFSYLIRMYDIHFLQWGGTGLLIQSMEFADGGSFGNWLKQHQKDWDCRRSKGLEYFKQACCGVGAIHKAGQTHRNLKPENLMFSNGALKVSDFGSIKNLSFPNAIDGHEVEISFWGDDASVNMNSETKMASCAQEFDEREDIFALGAILYEVLHPKCQSPFVVLKRSGINSLVDSLSLELIEINQDLAKIVTRCLYRDPELRYQDVWELIEDLEVRGVSGEKNKRLINIEDDQKTRQLNETWEKASSSYAQMDFNEAVRHIEHVLKINPEHMQAGQLREELERRSLQAEQVYQEITRNLDSGDLFDLIALLQEAIALYPEHPSAHLVQARLALKAKGFRRAMEKGETAFMEGCWEQALNWFEDAVRFHPGATELREIIESLTQLKGLRKTIDENIVEGNLEKASYLARLFDNVVGQMRISLPLMPGR